MKSKDQECAMEDYIYSIIPLWGMIGSQNVPGNEISDPCLVNVCKIFIMASADKTSRSTF